jgi:hypothetical protein
MRLLDHAIQEVQLSLGARPGANTPSIHLPDLVVPRWSRTTRSSLSPLGNFDDGTNLFQVTTLYAIDFFSRRRRRRDVLATTGF